WDEDNVRDIVHRGPKCIALKECNNVKIEGIKILNATDLAVYFAGCKDVKINNLYLKVYIDGISPDNSKDVVIKNCYVESGDDGIVFKSSYTLNRLDICKNILVSNCIIKSRCNAIKFGTETNGGFKDIIITNCKCFDSRITGISVESVDGAHVDNIILKNIDMNNVGSPFFVHLGQRLRGPEGSKIGSIKNVLFKNIKVTGPYHVYDCMPWNYVSLVNNDTKQFPGFYSKDKAEKEGTWQITSNVCGLKDHNLDNIRFEHIIMELDGGVEEYNPVVPDKAPEYPEVNVYGKILPASAIYFRYINSLILKDVKVKLLHQDKRPYYVFDSIKNKIIL
ncbi:MAG: glycosyl hydrolase family 28 protein, partial [bacterium]|nr:glycosyl hydrolase family 28 protein [bacterium]